LFKLVQWLKSHSDLKNCTAEDAFARLNNEVKPNWALLFPDVPLPSLEFVTAWEQVNTPAGMSLWQTIEERVTNQPLTLLGASPCEGFEHYLGVAFHLQRLTPRKDILLPVTRLSELLTKLLGKQVSEQSVSYYCRQAKSNGYLKLIAKAHHPSGKAARYRYDLTRFTDTGVELDDNGTNSQLATTNFSHGSHGIHGSEGSEGIEGSSGIEESSSSYVLEHVTTHRQDKYKNKQEENIEESVNTEKQVMLEKNTPSTILPFVKEKKKKKKKKAKRQSVVAVWQAFMCAKFGWQEKLPTADYEMLVKFGRKTDEFAPLIVTWILTNWDTVASAAVGPNVEYPADPNVAFFHAYEALAFNLWRNADLNSDEEAALIKACETSNKDFEELVWIYTLGEHTLFQNVMEQLKYQGLLLKIPKGWQVCGQTFQYITQIDDKYCQDEKFRYMLLEAVGIKVAQSCK
jgi:hypothetical protein